MGLRARSLPVRVLRRRNQGIPGERVYRMLLIADLLCWVYSLHRHRRVIASYLVHNYSKPTPCMRYKWHFSGLGLTSLAAWYPKPYYIKERSGSLAIAVAARLILIRLLHLPYVAAADGSPNRTLSFFKSLSNPITKSRCHAMPVAL